MNAPTQATMLSEYDDDDYLREVQEQYDFEQGQLANEEDIGYEHLYDEVADGSSSSESSDNSTVPPWKRGAACCCFARTRTS